VKPALLSAIVALVAAGCMGDGNKEPEPARKAAPEARSVKRYTAREFRWVMRLARWDRSYGSARSVADSAYYGLLDGQISVAEVRRALRPLRECRASVQRRIGEPPSEDLRFVYRQLLSACDGDRRFGVADLAVLTSSSDQGAATVAAFEDGEKRFRDAHRSVERRLLAYLPLPEVGGMTQKSRVEPRFSRVASKLALKPVEIRCWSPSEWKAAVREYELYTGHKADIAGFANGISRANLGARQCGDLARFTYDHWRPSSLRGLERASDAIELVAHETEHLLNPNASEEETECHGVQDVRRVARGLGASRRYARRLAGVYWQAIYPYNTHEYRTLDCRNSGLYDMNPSSNIWP
jgi:hypothetical protein